MKVLHQLKDTHLVSQAPNTQLGTSPPTGAHSLGRMHRCRLGEPTANDGGGPKQPHAEGSGATTGLETRETTQRTLRPDQSLRSDIKMELRRAS